MGTGDQPLTVVGVNLAVLHGHGKFSGKGLDFQIGDAVGEMAQGASKQQSVLLLFAANAAKDMQHQNPVARLPFGQEFGRLGPAAADQHRRGGARQQLLPGLPLGIAPALPGGGQDALGGEADHAARHQGLDHKGPLAIGHAADIPTVVVGPAALDSGGGGRQLAPAQGHRGRQPHHKGLAIKPAPLAAIRPHLPLLLAQGSDEAHQRQGQARGLQRFGLHFQADGPQAVLAHLHRTPQPHQLVVPRAGAG